MVEALSIRAVERRDASAIARIYAPIVNDTAISFELQAPTAKEMEQRVLDVIKTHPFLVADQGDQVQGYAYAARFKARAAYNKTAEVSVYVAPDAKGKAIGFRLMNALLDQMAEDGFKRAIATIVTPNPASIGLFESLGFSAAGGLQKVGYKFGRWHDIALYEREVRQRP